MSGRLTILPKKSYCPWNQENVERVLRDERLERERVEKEAKASREADGDSRRRRHQREGDDGPKTNDGDGHINLFPEAKEAELRLARGLHGPAKSKSDAKVDNSGVLPIPLGGEEAAKRKTGTVPFYLRSKTNKDGEEEIRYDGASGMYGLGNRRNGQGGPAAVDEITGKIMRDQYEKREDSRKHKMDPMSRFFAGNGSSQNNIPSKRNDVIGNGTSLSETKQQTDRGVDGERGSKRSHLDMANEKKIKEKLDKKKYRRKKSRRRSHDENDCSSLDSDSSTCSSSSSCSSTDGSSNHSNRHHKRRHSRSRKDAKHNSHTRDTSRSHSEGRRSHKKSRRRDSKRRRSSRRHRSPSSDRDNIGSNKHSQQNAADEQLEELRKRRRAREAREMEREKKILAPDAGTFAGNQLMNGHGGKRYQDQFNPTLSRN